MSADAVRCEVALDVSEMKWVVGVRSWIEVGDGIEMKS